jgi:hypothetical protein
MLTASALAFPASLSGACTGACGTTTDVRQVGQFCCRSSHDLRSGKPHAKP